MPVSHSVPWLRFRSPLIEPDVRISRIRLSDWISRRDPRDCVLQDVQLGAPCARRLSSRESPLPSSLRTARSEIVRHASGLQAFANFPALVLFPSAPEVRPLPSTGVDRLPRYYEPLRLPARLHAAHCDVEGRDSLVSPGLPRCAWCPFPRAVPTTPVDHVGCMRRLLPRRAAAFPFLQGGRRPPRHFRGLLRIHSRYGPWIRSRAFRPLLSRGFVATDCSAATLGSYGVVPTIPPAELSSAGHQRLSWRTAELPSREGGGILSS